MTKVLAKHHTIADWDFQRGALQRDLDTTYYISPPTSLHFKPGAEWLYNVILCRIPATQCLPQGEVRTWLRRYTPNTSACCATFRNQAPLGSAYLSNCYQLKVDFGAIGLWLVRADTWYEIDHWTYSLPENTWVRFRTFWYNGEKPDGTPALCVDLYREEAGEWVKMEDTKYDTANWWPDSEINRCGIWTYLNPYSHSWFDDTEIWGPV